MKIRKLSKLQLGGQGVNRLLLVMGLVFLGAACSSGGGGGSSNPAPLDAMKMVSVSAVGDAGDGDSVSEVISLNGRFAVVLSSANNMAVSAAQDFVDDQLYLVDSLDLEDTKLVSTPTNLLEGANGRSRAVAVSEDARFVLFESLATNLNDPVVEPVTDWQLYLRDVENSSTLLLSKAFIGTEFFSNAWWQNAHLSADGSKVYFQSTSSNLVAEAVDGSNNIYVYDLGLKLLQRLDVPQVGDNYKLNAVSSDGRYLFVGDVFGEIYRIDSEDTEVLEIVTADVDGAPSTNNGAFKHEFLWSSAAGDVVVFLSDADVLVSPGLNQEAVYVRNIANAKTSLLFDDQGVEFLAIDSETWLFDERLKYLFLRVQPSLVSEYFTIESASDAFTVVVVDMDTLKFRLVTHALSGSNVALDNANPFNVSADGAYVYFGTNSNDVVDSPSNIRSSAQVYKAPNPFLK